MVVYIIGKISDETPELEYANRDLAASVGAYLWERGIYSIIPHLNDYNQFLGHGSHFVWEDYMRGDQELLNKADAVIVLPNYQTSRGSLFEIEHAKQRGLRLFYWPDHPAFRKLSMTVLISGKQGSGKTHTARGVRGKLREMGYNCEIFKFADTLYTLHDIILDETDKYIEITRPQKGLLQLLGTEWGRNQIDKDIWVAITQRKLNKWFGLNNESNSIAILDDTRFQNEFDMNVKNKINIRLQCARDTRKSRCDTWRDNEQHLSETDLDMHESLGLFDYVLRTDDNDLATVTSMITEIILKHIGA
jgi:uridine kinase